MSRRRRRSGEPWQEPCPPAEKHPYGSGEGSTGSASNDARWMRHGSSRERGAWRRFDEAAVEVKRGGVDAGPPRRAARAAAVSDLMTVCASAQTLIAEGQCARRCAVVEQPATAATAQAQPARPVSDRSRLEEVPLTVLSSTPPRRACRDSRPIPASDRGPRGRGVGRGRFSRVFVNARFAGAAYGHETARRDSHP